jgi:hypothetical protein
MPPYDGLVGEKPVGVGVTHRLLTQWTKYAWMVNCIWFYTGRILENKT